MGVIIMKKLKTTSGVYAYVSNGQLVVAKELYTPDKFETPKIYASEQEAYEKLKHLIVEPEQDSETPFVSVFDNL